MDSKSLVGKTFGHWTVIGPSSDKYKVMCRCDCGKERPVRVYSLLNGSTVSCGHTRYAKISAKAVQDNEQMIGRGFGSWTVTAAVTNDPKKVLCRCQCGREKAVAISTLTSGKSKSCGCISHPRSPETKDRTRNAILKKAQENVGKTVNGFLIKKVYDKMYYGKMTVFCTAACPVCGNDTDVRLDVVTNGRIKKCKVCSYNVGKIKDAADGTINVGGTNLSTIKAIRAGQIRRNSATGVNGVSMTSKGQYRAYINFKRRQIHIGTFSTLEAAAAARAKAEKVIFQTVLDANAGWEDRYKEALKELQESLKKSH